MYMHMYIVQKRICIHVYMCIYSIAISIQARMDAHTPKT